jgi:hypothetical protein
MAKNGHGVSSKTHTQTQRDHHANQKNPNNSAYRANQNNHANQCNPNNKEYSHSRSGNGKK